MYTSYHIIIDFKYSKKKILIILLTLQNITYINILYNVPMGYLYLNCFFILFIINFKKIRLKETGLIKQL